MKIKFFVLAFFHFSLLFAQDVEDIINVCDIQAVGSSRTLAVGGAQTALGADVSSVYYNPATLGFLRKSEIAFGSLLFFDRTKSNYIESSNNFKSNFYANQFSFAINTTDDRKEKGLKAYTLAVNYQRINTFDRKIEAKGLNTESSITDYFAQQASIPQTDSSEAIFPDGFMDVNNIRNQQQMAWLGGLLLHEGDGTYGSVLNGAPIFQDISITSFGVLNNWDFALGLNYNDKFYVGGSVVLQSYKHSKKLVVKEEDVSDTIPDFDYFEYVENKDVKANGYAFKTGIIYKFSNRFRMGFSVQSPVRFKYQKDVNFFLEDVRYAKGNTQEYSFKGKSDTQKSTFLGVARINAGAVYVFQKSGFLSMDVEYGKTPDFNSALLNARLGGECRFSENFYVRGGFSYGSFVNKRSIYSSGLGYRDDNLFIDFALNFYRFRSEFYPYVLNNFSNRFIELKTTKINTVVTFGVKF